MKSGRHMGRGGGGGGGGGGQCLTAAMLPAERAVLSKLLDSSVVFHKLLLHSNAGDDKTTA